VELTLPRLDPPLYLKQIDSYAERRKFVLTLYQGTASAVPKTFRQKLLSSHSAGATPLAAAPAECITNEVM
jgi:hypothetical protein